MLTLPSASSFRLARELLPCFLVSSDGGRFFINPKTRETSPSPARSDEGFPRRRACPTPSATAASSALFFSCFSPLYHREEDNFPNQEVVEKEGRKRMSRLAVVVYHGNTLLGEANVYPQNERFEAMDACKKEIRITRLSPSSERCPPLAVLHTISSRGVCFKMESKSQAQDSPFFCLYNTCLRENKTAIVPLGEEDLHLVAMPARNKLQHY